MESFYRTITRLGSFLPVIIVSTLFLIFIRQDLSAVMYFILAIVTSAASTHLLKLMTRKPRRFDALVHERTYAFPSSHSAIAVSLYGFITLYLRLWPLVALAILLIALISYSRIHLKVHDWTDVSVGLTIGVLTLTPYTLYLFKNGVL